MTYTVPKKSFTKDSIIEKMEIFFSNGDYLTIRKNEICSVSITFYDKLTKRGREFFAIGHSGFIKLRIQSGKAKGESHCLHNASEYTKNRKKYIEDRVKQDSYIECIRLYNQLNWSDCIFGDIYAELEGEYLYIKFKENERYGSFESDSHYIDIAPPSKDMIFKMSLDFENCDYIDVYNSEIKEMSLVFDKNLVWNAPGYIRYVKSGYLIIKLDKRFENRGSNVWCEDEKATFKKLEQRICGNNIDSIDICHLYLDFHHFCNQEGETIEISSIDESDENFFISGYAKKLDDGSIMIVFGEKSE